MNKVLFTSAMFALAASSALAHEAGPKVTLGGSLDTQVGFNHEKKLFKQKDVTKPASATNSKVHDYAIVNDTSVHVKVDGKAHGMGYGGMIKLNADTSSSKVGSSDKASQTMMYLESKFGRMEAGSYTGSYNAMKVDASSFARATGGIDGDSRYYFNQSFANGGELTGRSNMHQPGRGEFITSPSLPTNYDDNKVANAAKINLYTPSFAGFKAGLTFTPDTDQHGTVNRYHSVTKKSEIDGANKLATDTRFSGYRNVVQGGLHYAGKFDKVGVKFAALGEMGKAKNFSSTGTPSFDFKRHDLRAYEVGANLSYMGFTFGGSYGDMGKSGLVKSATNIATGAPLAFTGKKTAKYYTVGLGYEHGNFGTSLGYFKSASKGFTENKVLASATPTTVSYSGKGEFSNVSLGVDYKLAPGFMPYAEVSVFEMKDKAYTVTGANAEPKKNSGTIVLVGSKLQF